MQPRQTNRNQKADGSQEVYLRLLHARNFAAADNLIDDLVAHTSQLSAKRCLNHALHVFGKLGQSDVAGWVVEKLISLGIQPDVLIFNRLLAACSKAGDLQTAVAWWVYLVSLGAVPNNITYNTMIHACAQANDSQSAVYWMNQLLVSDVQPCKVSFATIISVFAKSGNWQEAELWFSKMEELRLLPDTCIFNNMISACAKANEFTRAELWLSRMDSYVLSADQKTYNALINLCAKLGDLAKAKALYTKMQDAGQEPDVFTFGPMLYACMMVADLQAAEDVMQDMEKRGIHPNLVCYNTMIHCCAVCGDAEKAMMWYERLKAQGLQAKKITFNYLLSACLTSGRKDLSEKVLFNMSLSGFHVTQRDYMELEVVTAEQFQPWICSLLDNSLHRGARRSGTLKTYGICSDGLDGGCHGYGTGLSTKVFDSSRDAWSLSHQGHPSTTNDDFLKHKEALEQNIHHVSNEPLHADLSVVDALQVPNLTDDDFLKHKDALEQSVHRVDNEPLHADLSGLDAFQAPNLEKSAKTLASPCAKKIAYDDLDGFTTASSCHDMIGSLDNIELTAASTGPDPSEIDSIPLVWRKHASTSAC
eukprot:TRINITY_DN6674_c0_g1_i1.p1 TRINITY_DN6674_c0_g1~~TRINITY_DN6674_c0_g1_i1.p1  ORF type:complete len:606 (-),score=78.38 TRINITY_DN6674_c0_g1_i1:249-2018(-)